MKHKIDTEEGVLIRINSKGMATIRLDPAQVFDKEGVPMSTNPKDKLLATIHIDDLMRGDIIHEIRLLDIK